MKKLSLLSLFVATAFFARISAASAADLTITAASFRLGPRAKVTHGVTAVAVTAGQAVYMDGNGYYQLADANGTGTTSVAGLATHAAAANQPLTIVYEDDDLTLGATLSMTAPVYVLSGTAGGIAPTADIVAGWHPKPLLVAKSATKAVLFRVRNLQFTAAAE